MMFKLLKSQKGQTIGLFPIISIVLIVAIFFIYNIGDYYYATVREQSAIDAAVYSGAAMQADALDMVVYINKTLVAIYFISIGVCAAAIIAAAAATVATLGVNALAAPEELSLVCGGAGAGFLIVEAAAKGTLTMLNDTTGPAFIAASMKIYKDNGGKADFPAVTIYVSSLKLEKITWNDFIMPCGSAPYFKIHKTFVGMVEQQHKGDGVYSWCQQQYDDNTKVCGSFGKRQNDNLSESGLYAKDGPLAVGYAQSTFTPMTSWFSKYSKQIIVVAEARPYGGTVEPVTAKQVLDSIPGVNLLDKVPGISSLVSSLFSDIDIPWGHADFKVKLVPIGF